MDPNYRPEFMLGMNKDQSKEMLEKMFASYTHREDLRDNINNYEDIRQAIEDIDFLKYQQGTNTLRVYDGEPKEIQGNFRDLYMHKEVMKDELKQRNVFWRWFSRDARAMRKYIKVAEQTLKSAQFPRSAEQLAKEELNGPAVREDYRKQAAGSIDKHFEKHAARYEEIRNKQKLLTVRFHPEQSNLKSYLKAAEELGELLNADKGNLAPEVKEVFNLNREKLSRLEKAAEIRKNGAQMQLGFAEGSYVQMEIEFEKKHPDLKNISFEDVEKECLKEKVSVNDSLSESNQEIKPKEAEPTVVKESPVQSV
jgi:hypothetical protein